MDIPVIIVHVIPSLYLSSKCSNLLFLSNGFAFLLMSLSCAAYWLMLTSRQTTILTLILTNTHSSGLIQVCNAFHHYVKSQWIKSSPASFSFSLMDVTIFN